MRTKTIVFTMAVADADGICESQKPNAGGSQSLDIDGAYASGGVATLDVTRHISLTSSANDSSRTFTITGTDRQGNTLIEILTGPNTTTKNGAKNFSTITDVSVDENTAGNIKVGTADELESPIIPIDSRNDKISYSVDLSDGANLKYKTKYTLDNVFASSFREDTAKYYDESGEKNTDYAAKISISITGFRIAVYDYVSGTVTLRIIPSIS